MSIPSKFSFFDKLKMGLFIDMIWRKNLYNTGSKHISVKHYDSQSGKYYKVKIRVDIEHFDDGLVK